MEVLVVVKEADKTVKEVTKVIKAKMGVVDMEEGKEVEKVEVEMEVEEMGRVQMEVVKKEV